MLDFQLWQNSIFNVKYSDYINTNFSQFSHNRTVANKMLHQYHEEVRQTKLSLTFKALRQSVDHVN